LNALISQLKKIIAKNPLGEKVLIVPAYSAGRLFVESCTRQGLKTLNLRIHTLPGLAEEISKYTLYKSKRTLIPDTLAKELIIEVLKNLKTQNELKYFSSLEITPGIGKAIYQTIIDLKMAGMSIDRIDPALFLDAGKGEDVLKIRLEYESELAKLNYLDLPDLFLLAGRQNIPAIPHTYIVPSNLRLTPVERSFLKNLTHDNFEVIHFPKPQGLALPQGSLEQELIPPAELTAGEAAGEKQLSSNGLLWLYDLSKVPADQKLTADTFQTNQKLSADMLQADQGLTINMFHAYGEMSEVREVVRRIKKQSLPLDHAVVFYTARHPYTHLFYTLAQELNLPVTFGQGIDLGYTRPGRLLSGFLAWAEGGFKAADLVPLIAGGDFMIADEKAPSKFVITRFLRTSGIGWGRKRYHSVLENELESLENAASKSSTSKSSTSESSASAKDEYYKQHLLWLKNFFDLIFAAFPEPDSENRLSFGKVAAWLCDLIDNFSSVANPADREAKKIISEELQLIKDFSGEELEPEEACQRLAAVLAEKRVNISGPQPGCLHVDYYQAGIWMSRPYVFVVGLDANRFPGSPAEDPILLDVERKNLGHELPLLGQKAKEKIYDLVQGLSLNAKTLTVSYSAYDTVENRMVFPAAVLLQIHRLLNGDPTLDYSHLLHALGERKGFIPGQPDESLEETGWWLNVLTTGLPSPKQSPSQNPNTRQDPRQSTNSNINLAAIKQMFPDLFSGMQAESKREAPVLTSFDGKVEVDCNQVDPTVAPELVVSCSQLETLAKCPFAYFLRYVLRVKPVEELLYDPNSWLDAKTLGDLYHSIFENFYKDLTARGETPALSRHENHLYEIADELIAEKKQLVPPPSELVYENERRIILDSCRVFLVSEEAEARKGTPKYFELTFGGFGETTDKDSFEPVRLILPNGKKFFLQGRIDRVDETPEGFKVWDYKTGRPDGYSDSKYFQGGRQLQHGLYSLALEELLRQNGLAAQPKVLASGYIFPTLKGEGRRVVRQQARRDSLYEILEHLFNFLAQGVFVMTDNPNDCYHCHYHDVCNRAYRSQEALEKMKVEELRRLRSYA